MKPARSVTLTGVRTSSSDYINASYHKIKKLITYMTITTNHLYSYSMHLYNLQIIYEVID